MDVYLIVEITPEGEMETRIGGGSSTPASVRLYESLPKAKAGLNRLRNDYKKTRIILKINLEDAEEIS